MTARTSLRLAWRDDDAGTAAPQDAAPSQTGQVTDVRDGAAFVQTGAGIAKARIALSCIVLPEAGDRVLLHTADGIPWILAVLERSASGPIRLATTRDIALVSSHGTVSVAAAQAVRLEAGTDASVTAGALTVHAPRARLMLDDVLHVGRRISAHIARVRVIGELIESFADHVLTRAKRSTRLIEETDHLRSSDIDHRATGTLQLHARTSLVTADTIVRVDADQIHMG